MVGQGGARVRDRCGVRARARVGAGVSSRAVGGTCSAELNELGGLAMVKK